jgi:hypothetical protein
VGEKAESELPQPRVGLELDKNLNRLTRTAWAEDGPLGDPAKGEKDIHALSQREQAIHPAQRWNMAPPTGSSLPEVGLEASVGTYE